MYNYFWRLHSPPIYSISRLVLCTCRSKIYDDDDDDDYCKLRIEPWSALQSVVVWRHSARDDVTSGAVRGQHPLPASKSRDFCRRVSADRRRTGCLESDGLERPGRRRWPRLGRLGSGVRARPSRVSSRPYVLLRGRKHPAETRPSGLDCPRPLPSLFRHRNVWRCRSPGTVVVHFSQRLRIRDRWFYEIHKKSWFFHLLHVTNLDFSNSDWT